MTDKKRYLVKVVYMTTLEVEVFAEDEQAAVDYVIDQAHFDGSGDASFEVPTPALDSTYSAEVPEVYESQDVPGKWGYVGCESDDYDSQEEAEEAAREYVAQSADMQDWH